MKKILAVAMASCFVVSGCFMLGACGGSDYNHTIVFYSSQGDSLVSVTDWAIEQFEEKYPGWKVEHSQPGGYDDVRDKVRSDLTAGSQPDLAYCYADHVALYIASGKVVDMNKYLTNAEPYTYTIGEESTTIDRIGFTEEDKASFIEGFFNEGLAENFTGYEEGGLTETALITLPFVKSTELMFYNPDALKEMGFEEPPATWDELWDMCTVAKQLWPKCTPLGYDSEANWFITMSEQLDFDYTDVEANNHYLFNNDGAKAWLEEIHGYYDLGYITTQAIYGSYTSSLFVKGPEEGGLVFCIGSSGGASHQGGNGFTTEVTSIPATIRENDETETPHGECISQGPSLVMLTGGNGAENPTEKEIMTFQFVKELLSVTFQSKFAIASGYNPMRSDVYNEAKFKLFTEGKDENNKALTGTNLLISKCVNAGTRLNNSFFTSPAFVGSSTAREQMTSVVQRVLLGQSSPEAALDYAYRACGGK